MTDEEKALFDEGHDARRAGLAISDCPYPAYSTDEADWLVGWRSADSGRFD